MSEKNVILELKKLKKHFILKRGASIKALEDVSFSLYEGEKFGVVGESGCGKSTLGRVILQLYPQTSGACIYYGKTLEEVAPRYVKREIRRLPKYQLTATEMYQKSLQVDREAELLEQSKADPAKLERLRLRSKELRKEASRQLREGSRIVGSLILNEKLLDIQMLFEKSQQELMLARKALRQCARYDAAYQKSQALGAADNAILKKLTSCKEEAEEHRRKAKEYRDQAFAYRGKNILPITERCEDPAYQDKLDSNYETGVNLGKLTGREMRALRRDMQMIFQDPAASLDPRQSVGSALEEVFRINTPYGPEVRREKAKALLAKVGLSPEHYAAYPHAISGGQKQRVGIARAIALDPKFIVLDESVSALDVSVQAQILELLEELSEEKHLTYFFITHDLGVVKHFCDRILVMYLGHVCELADSKDLFKNPMHPYTDSLLASVPRPVVREGEMDEKVLEGEVPSAVNPPKGCPFHTRCEHCMDICKKERPTLTEVAPKHFVACFLHTKKAETPAMEEAYDV